LTADTIALFKKRVYDIAAVTDKSVKVKYNGTLVPVKQFQQYTELYLRKDNDEKVHEEAGPRWEYAVALTQKNEFSQVSFVNGIYTSKGGKHVEYILNQITKKMVALIEKKKKITVNANTIKEQILLFVRCDIENPAFDSQTKDYMNTPSSKFGSSCTVSDKFIEKIAKLGIMDAACALTEVKENKAAKKTDGSKTKTIRGIPKLIDANWAGTEKSKQCVIIFCEGDSAKAGIVSGLSSEDRNTIGVYPMKGKILNVRGEATKKISENKEISEIKKILGLETGKEYTSTDALRYGRVLFLCDQDVDGSHIKGLCINLFQSEWASLARIPGFIGFMNTPILKARRGQQQELVFYNDGEYETWKTSVGETEARHWNIKYYKGLGTSTGKEFREYFEKKKMVGFEHTGKNSEDAIDMVFNKKRADDRKGWLEDYSRDAFLNTNDTMVRYEDFIHKELIHFSKYDCDRSIPNVMDGLKISLRKILYAAFKRGLTSEIKVAQFSGYVSEHSGYHHGEASLNAAIVGMAQNFVGSNNINLLLPNGQFGTRLAGGQDSASERYIFTQLSHLTRSLFPVADDGILHYLNDDGFQVEPLYYAPILPMVLVNGAKGIGTGFSTEIMCYNPMDLVHYISDKLSGTSSSSTKTQFVPYYEGFKGSIVQKEDNKYLICGLYETTGTDKIRVTELPVGLWTNDFKELLESLTESTDKTGKKVTPIVKDYEDFSTDTVVDFRITLAKGKKAELESVILENNRNGLEKQFKLYTNNSCSNMHLFDANDKLKKYGSVNEIIDDYYVTRLALYGKRKAHQLCLLDKDLKTLTNKTRFLQELLDDTIDLRRKRGDEVHQLLTTKGYDKEEGDYKYLTRMSMESVTQEHVEKWIQDHKEKTEQRIQLEATSIETMWNTDLCAFREKYIQYKKTPLQKKK